MGVDDDALGLAKGNTQHHVRGLAAHAWKRDEFVEGTRNGAAVALLQLESKTDDVFRLLTKHTEATKHRFHL